MGNIIECQSSNKLYEEIIAEVNKLIHNRYKPQLYQTTKDCDKIILLYTERLSNVGKDILSDVPITLGYGVKVMNKSRADICKIITNHYIERIKLLDEIFKTLEHCKIALSKAREGGFCYIRTNNKRLYKHNINENEYAAYSVEINDIDKCQASKKEEWVENAFWIDKAQLMVIKKKLKHNKKYNEYANSINNIDKKFYKHLQAIKDYVKKIEDDINNPLPKSQFDDMAEKLSILLEDTKKEVDLFYALTMEHLID